jgi:integrase
VRLTDIVVRNLPAPPSGSKVYVDDVPRGFGVRVTKAGVKAFVLTYGKQRERVTIGRYPVIGLADARIEAKRILAERTLGKLRPKRLTFEEALTIFIETRRQKSRPRTARETEKLLRGYFKKLHSTNLEDIAAHQIADITDKLAKAGLQSTAAHAHTAVKTFFKWCAQRGYLTSSPISELEKPALPKSRERTLTDEELCTVWRAADEQGGHFGAIVKLLILTGQRRSEIGSLQAGYITDTSICLPSEITKNRRAHTFPIGSTTAATLSSNTTTGTTTIFPARGKPTQPFNGWSKAKAELDQKAKIAPWTLHDLRRTFATGLQRLGVRIEVIEALLNHVSGTRAGIVGVYQRHHYQDEMREAVERWESHLRTILKERNVEELTATVAQP